MTRADCEALLETGKRLAAKATTAAGEFAAWDQAVAQYIDVLGDEGWTPPRGLLRLLAQRDRKRGVVGTPNNKPGTLAKYQGEPAGSRETPCGMHARGETPSRSSQLPVASVDGRDTANTAGRLGEVGIFVPLSSVRS